MIYTVTINPALDYVLHLNESLNKDVNRAKAVRLNYGGKGINVSVVLSRFGIGTKALGFVAGFTGEELERMLERDGVNTDFIHLSNGMTRINVQIIEQRQIGINAPGFNISDEDMEHLYEKTGELKSGDFLVLAGSAPSGIYEKIIKKLQGRGIRFVVDTTGEELMRVLECEPFLIKPNHHELAELFGTDISPTDTDKIEHYAKTLQEKGAKNVIVSRGKYGATLLDEYGNVHSLGIVEGKPVNNVGCGDSMVAGFLAGYQMDGGYQNAFKWASAAGNATAFCEGLAQFEDIKRIKDAYFQ